MNDERAASRLVATHRPAAQSERRYVEQLCSDPDRHCRPAETLKKFDVLLKPVFQQGLTTIYQIRYQKGFSSHTPRDYPPERYKRCRVAFWAAWEMKIERRHYYDQRENISQVG